MKRAPACLLLFLIVSTGCLRREPPGQCFAYCTDDECLLCDEQGCAPVATYQAWNFPACGEGNEGAMPVPDPGGAPAANDGDFVSVAPDPHPGKDDPDPCTDDPDGCPTATPDPDLLCVHNGQCGGGQCRDDGTCHAACLVNDDCGTGDLCVSGFCERDPSPEKPCLFTTDCPSGDRCVEGTCFLACGVDANCPDPVDFCDRGLCRPDWRRVSECSTGTDCAASEDCVDGQCLTACFDDHDCLECADGPVCDGGYCGGAP